MASELDRARPRGSIASAERHRRSRDFTLNSLTRRAARGRSPPSRSTAPTSRPTPTVSTQRDRAVDRARGRAAPSRRNPTINGRSSTSCATCCCCATRPAPTRRAARSSSRFVMQLPAADRPGHGQGRRGHRLLRLQPPGRRSTRWAATRALRHRRRRVPRAERRARRQRWPHGCCATATHDTKRGEDVRARLNVLSEMPREWRARLARWRRLNQRRRPSGRRAARARPQRGVPLLPDPGRRLAARARRRRTRWQALVDRLAAYMRKAMREAKVHTSWINPNDGVRGGAAALRRPASSTGGSARRSWPTSAPSRGRSARSGMLNSLAQAAAEAHLRPASPTSTRAPSCGTSRLVDPDNRRPVDFAGARGCSRSWIARRCRGADLRALAAELLAARRDGRVKLYLIWQALAARRRHPALQPGGGYRPLAVTGGRAEHVCAFAREAGDGPRGDRRAAVADPPRGPRPAAAGTRRLETAVSLTGLPAAPRYRNVFTGEPVDPSLPLASVLATFPVALPRTGSNLPADDDVALAALALDPEEDLLVGGAVRAHGLLQVFHALDAGAVDLADDVALGDPRLVGR